MPNIGNSFKDQTAKLTSKKRHMSYSDLGVTKRQRSATTIERPDVISFVSSSKTRDDIQKEEAEIVKQEVSESSDRPEVNVVQFEALPPLVMPIPVPEQTDNVDDQLASMVSFDLDYLLFIEYFDVKKNFVLSGSVLVASRLEGFTLSTIFS